MADGVAGLEAGFGRTLDLSYGEALRRAEQALEREGFGILTRIDVREALREKLGVDFPAFQILGACRPPLAHQALLREPGVGVLLPCNVVVREVEDGRARVEVMNARAMVRMFPEAGLDAVAAEVMERLERVLASI